MDSTVRCRWDGGGGFRGGSVGENIAANQVRAKNNYIDTAVLCSARLGFVAGDGMIFGVPGGGKAVRREAVADDQQADQFGRPGCRQLPVRRHLNCVNGNVVGVTLDPKAAGANGQNGCDPVESRQCGRL
jgi:hypothetical protein